MNEILISQANNGYIISHEAFDSTLQETKVYATLDEALDEIRELFTGSAGS